MADLSTMSLLTKLVVAAFLFITPLAFANGMMCVHNPSLGLSDAWYNLSWQIPCLLVKQEPVVLVVYFMAKYGLKYILWITGLILVLSSLRFFNYYFIGLDLGTEMLPVCQGTCSFMKDAYQKVELHMTDGSPNIWFDGNALFRSDVVENNVVGIVFITLEGLRRFSVLETLFWLLVSVPFGFDTIVSFFLLRLCTREKADRQGKNIGKYPGVYLFLFFCILLAWSYEASGRLMEFLATHHDWGLLGWIGDKDFDMLGSGMVTVVGERMVVPVMLLVFPLMGWALRQVQDRSSVFCTWLLRGALFFCFLQNIAATLVIFLCYRELQPHTTLYGTFESTGGGWPNLATGPKKEK